MPRLHSPSGGRPGDAVSAAGAVAGAVGGIVGPGQEPWQHRGVQKVQGLLRKEPKLDRLKHQIMRKSWKMHHLHHHLGIFRGYPTFRQTMWPMAISFHLWKYLAWLILMGLVSPNLTLSPWLEHDSHKGGRSLHFAMVHNFAWLLYSIKDIRKAQCGEWVEPVPMARHMRLKHHPRWQSRVGSSGWWPNISTIVLCPESPGTIRNSLGRLDCTFTNQKLCFACCPYFKKLSGNLHGEPWERWSA